MVPGGHRLREAMAIQNRLHHAIKGWPIRLSKIPHEHSGFSIGQHDRIPGGLVNGRLFKPDIAQASHASSIVDDDFFSTLNRSQRFLFAYQFSASASRDEDRQAFLEPVRQGIYATPPIHPAM